MSALFRREAIDGQRLAWLGEVRLLPPPSLTLLTGVAAGVAASVIAFLLLAEIAPRARLSGVVFAGAPGGAGPGPAAMQATVCASSSTVGMLRAGQSVRLYYEAFGSRQAPHPPEGRIAHVARTPVHPQANDACRGTAADGGDVYLVLVSLASQTVKVDGAAQRLEAGMRVQAEVLLDRRRLTQWIFGGGPAAPGLDD